MKCEIVSLSAREILDSRGTPTVCCRVELADGTVEEASVPSGASTGRFEAFEKRDGDPARYGGRGVLGAVEAVNRTLFPLLAGKRADEQWQLDTLLAEADRTENKSNLGANALLAVSLACARASARSWGLPLFRYLGGIRAVTLPVPMMNILNGGVHARNNLDVQEYMILPLGAENAAEAVRIGAEVSSCLRTLLSDRGIPFSMGDEGGVAPDLPDDEEGVKWICEAIERAGYHTDKIAVGLDVAASAWQTEPGVYRLPKRGEVLSSAEMIDRWRTWADRYPLVSLEDGLGEEDYEGWRTLTEMLGDQLMLVGDDLFVTQPARLERGIEGHLANAVLVKPNQIGTLSEALTVMDLARQEGYRTVVSHRSGETTDTFIADLAVAAGAGFLKAGAPYRGERVAKYNRLTEIEALLGGHSAFGMR